MSADERLEYAVQTTMGRVYERKESRQLKAVIGSPNRALGCNVVFVAYLVNETAPHQSVGISVSGVNSKAQPYQGVVDIGGNLGAHVDAKTQRLAEQIYSIWKLPSLRPQVYPVAILLPDALPAEPLTLRLTVKQDTRRGDSITIGPTIDSLEFEFDIRDGR